MFDQQQFSDGKSSVEAKNDQLEDTHISRVAKVSELSHEELMKVQVNTKTETEQNVDIAEEIEETDEIYPSVKNLRQ